MGANGATDHWLRLWQGQAGRGESPGPEALEAQDRPLAPPSHLPPLHTPSPPPLPSPGRLPAPPQGLREPGRLRTLRRGRHAPGGKRAQGSSCFLTNHLPSCPQLLSSSLFAFTSCGSNPSIQSKTRSQHIWIPSLHGSHTIEPAGAQPRWPSSLQLPLLPEWRPVGGLGLLLTALLPIDLSLCLAEVLALLPVKLQN